MTLPDDAYRLSIAPMMSYTDRHYRYMMRLLTRRSLLYTEMVVGSTITHNLGDRRLDRALGFDDIEHPIAVQLGGDDPETMRISAKVCEDYGYDEINLNVGCPSDRVQRGRFGACLMREPERVAEVLSTMREAVSIPVTVKHRIGVDDEDSYEHLYRFVDIVSKAGTDVFIVHARKAWLKGLSPAQNRSIPPLLYDFVYRMKQEFPHLTVVINGGILTLDEVKDHLSHVDGVMLGRAAYNQPQMFQEADEQIFGEEPVPSIADLDLIEAMNEYAHKRIAEGDKLSFIVKHLVGLFKNRPHSRKWRQNITHLIQKNPAEFDLTQIYRDTFL